MRLLLASCALLIIRCGAGRPRGPEDTRSAQTSQTEKDPVCGMKVDPKTAPSSTYKGKKYYFCSPEEKVDLDKDPAKYVAAN